MQPPTSLQCSDHDKSLSTSDVDEHRHWRRRETDGESKLQGILGGTAFVRRLSTGEPELRLRAGCSVIQEMTASSLGRSTRFAHSGRRRASGK